MIHSIDNSGIGDQDSGFVASDDKDFRFPNHEPRTTNLRITKHEVGGYKDRFWYPRFWDGMTLRAWWKLLHRGGYRVAPIRWGMAVVITGLAVTTNSPFAFLQRLFYGRKIRNTELVAPPIFILGHWRSGTTLLHEYMICDERLAFSDTYACFAPEHFIMSRYALRPLAAILMPTKRPIDNMEAGFDRPQEDEFALTSMGLPSPYRNLIFPNNKMKIDVDYLTMRNLTDAQRKEWLDGLDFFLKALTYLTPKRLVLKSPPHTARIRTLLQRYPDAKFVHIHRNPYSLFPSTHNLWMRLSRDEGAQRPNGEGMEEYVFDSLVRMYEAFAEDVPLLKPGQYCEVAYKELTARPMETLEKLYRELELDGYENVRPEIEKFAATQKEYKKNKFEIASELKQKIADRWTWYFDHYGYEK